MYIRPATTFDAGGSVTIHMGQLHIVHDNERTMKGTMNRGDFVEIR